MAIYILTAVPKDEHCLGCGVKAGRGVRVRFLALGSYTLCFCRTCLARLGRVVQDELERMGSPSTP